MAAIARTGDTSSRSSQRCPDAFAYVVICGLTGSGKSRLLVALAAEGAQVLDLEALARHRGSLLGDLPDGPAAVAEIVRDPAGSRRSTGSIRRVRSTSNRRAGRSAPSSFPTRCLPRCARPSASGVELPRPLRVELLKHEYAHFLADRAALAERLQHLVPLHGKATVARWTDAAQAGDWDARGRRAARAFTTIPCTGGRSTGISPGSRRPLPAAPGSVTDVAFQALAREVDARVQSGAPHAQGKVPIDRR